MKMKLKSNLDMSKCQSQRSFEESDKLCAKDRDMAFSSTPVKANERKSVSLSDISEINISTETLASSSSMCKDSGYNHSESSLLSEKVKEECLFPLDYRSEYLRLIEDVKFKDIMISSLHESNHSLRMRLAEAENKISELRFKSQSHCRCCTYHSFNDSADHKLSEKVNVKLQYSVSPLTRSEPCLLISPPRMNDRERTNRKILTQDEPGILPSDDSFSKVKQWQNTFTDLESHKRLHSNIPPSIPNLPTDSPRIYIRPVPAPLPHNMSYMETSRTLAETYRRRQDRTSDIFSFQVIGDHSVSVTPVAIAHGLSADCGDLYKNEYNKNKSANQEPKTPDESTARQKILQNILFRNQDLLRRSTIFDAIALRSFKAPLLNTEYFKQFLVPQHY